MLRRMPKTVDWSRADSIALDVIAAGGGVAKLQAFLAAGLSGSQVAAMTYRGVLERPRYAWYVDPSLPWQAKCAVRVGGVLACVSAVDSFGLPVPPQPTRLVHVSVPGNSARRRHHRDKHHYVVPDEDREIRVHWAASDGASAGWRTGLVGSLVALVECVPPDWFVAALDAALHAPRDGSALLAAEGLRELQLRLPDKYRGLLPLIDPRAESPLETLLRLEMRRRGITGVELQVWIHQGRRVDFLIDGRLIVEADGEAYHDPVEDRRRDEEAARDGYDTMRFGYEEIVFGVEHVVDLIESALAR